MEPTEEQYLVLNALDTLEILGYNFFDEEHGIWYIETISQILSIAKLLPTGEIVPIEPESEL